MKKGKVFTQMKCKTTGKLEDQITVRESEDGIYLRCAGCGKENGYEIGFFDYLFNANQQTRKET